MAELRAEKSGINADMQDKLDATYIVEDEVKARRWMEAISGEAIGEDFFDYLHDGSYLCRLLNILESGTVPAKYGKPAKTPFLKMESVGQFIVGCKKYGMYEKDLFVTVDLYEKTNKNMVLSTIIALGRHAQKKGRGGPTLGPKEATANPRDQDEQRNKEGRNVIGLQMGTNKVAHQAGMTPYGMGRQVYDPKI